MKKRDEFTAADFDVTFERNAQAAPFKAQARLNGRLLSIAVFDEQQYHAILKQSGTPRLKGRGRENCSAP